MTPLFRQRAFSLVPALFLIVVLAALGAAAVKIGGVQQQTVSLSMQASRAFSAAESGIEWAAYEALANGNCGSATLPLTEGGLTGFTIDTSCSSSSHAEGSGTVQVFVIESFAHSGVYGRPDYVSRRIRATVTDAS